MLARQSERAKLVVYRVDGFNVAAGLELCHKLVDKLARLVERNRRVHRGRSDAAPWQLAPTGLSHGHAKDGVFFKRAKNQTVDIQGMVSQPHASASKAVEADQCLFTAKAGSTKASSRGASSSAAHRHDISSIFDRRHEVGSNGILGLSRPREFKIHVCANGNVC